MPYGLVSGINNITDKYSTYALIRNPLAAAIIVTFIALSVVYIFPTTPIIGVPIVTALLANSIYLFFYHSAIKKHYTSSREKEQHQAVVSEINNTPS